MRKDALVNDSPISQLEDWFLSDAAFHKLYPPFIQTFSRNHWTPLLVAQKATRFLAAEKGVRILDIGSGIGKFCLAAAHYQPQASYTGVEQRADLFEMSENAREQLGMDNVHFIHGNFTDIDFSRFDHYYFYNAFYENIAGSERIDESIPYSIERYNQYHYHLYKQLEKRPSGTRVATYFGMDDQMPIGYHVVGSDVNELLRFWIRE